ncbi:hypothetical protein HYU23_00035 [Candidatus Woesearchaeota archaeon]|nr:hypothetical protein [Candidatus Woesearchaeota archaeon]
MLDTKQTYKIRKFINELKQYRGRHTEFVSVYVPAGYDLIKIIQHLAQEQGTASNIKDKTTRLNVQDSLERMIRHLRLYQRTPENGIAAFSGNIASQEGKQDIKVWSIEPPVPINVRMYRCDQTFVLGPLEEMMQINEIYGLIVMDNREATIGFLKGKSIVVIRDFTSSVPGKVKVGGWCLDPESLIYLEDGRIVPIKEVNKNNTLRGFNFSNVSINNSKVLNSSITKHKKILRVITGYPRLEIGASPNHTFFIWNKGKISEKIASELKIDEDFLLMPEKIDFNGQLQKLNYKGDGSTKLPVSLTEDLARFVGYIVGDGSYDKDDRIELVKIMVSRNEVVASFLKGIFDAEGYPVKDEVGIAMKNKLLVNQIRLLLLRFSIIGSFCYAGRGKWVIRITDKESLINFKNYIGFVAEEKTSKLNKLIDSTTNRNNIRQVTYSGKGIRELIECSGYLKQDFKNVSLFFYDKRGMSKGIFNRVFLNRLIDEVELYEELKKIVDYPLIPVKIKKIEVIEGEKDLIDISVENKNFFVNGILVHNSQQRYARLREEAANEFYKRIAEVANVEFAAVGVKDLKGILIGGPGPTKETFVNGDHLHNELKKKIVAIKDITYTDEQGLHELVERSQDALAEAEIIKEKAIINEFFTLLSTNSDKVVYGAGDVMKALDYGAVDKLLLSESFSRIDEFEEKANTTGTKVFIISTETKEGVQLKELGGVAAIMRYAIEF